MRGNSMSKRNILDLSSKPVFLKSSFFELCLWEVSTEYFLLFDLYPFKMYLC